MKTLLIPTDFNIRTLSCIPYLLQRHYPHKVNVILVHMMKITDNIKELHMLAKRSTERKYISTELYNACAVLKHKYADCLEDVRIEFFYGSTLALFKSFLLANEVDSIVMLEDHQYAMLNKTSIKPALMVSRSGINIITFNCTNNINELFDQENLLAKAV